MADVDILRYVITGDNKGLVTALKEADQATATSTKNIIQKTAGIDAGFSKAFSVKHRSLVDGINSSIISMAGSMIPLGGNTRLAALALSQMSGFLFAFGGPVTVALVALGGLAAAFALTRDRSKEVSEALNTNATLLLKFASGAGPDAARAYESINFQLREIARLLRELESPRENELSFWEKLKIQIGFVNSALDSYLKRQKENTDQTLKLKAAQEELAKANLAAIPGLAIGRSGAVAHQELLEAQGRAAEESAKIWQEAFAIFWENFKDELVRASAQAAARAKSNLTDLTNSLFKTARQSTVQLSFDLRDALHQAAFDFRSVLGEAAENFIHQMIEGLSTIGANLKALQAGGTAGLAGGLGIAGTVFGVVGSIVDMFSSGAEKIFKSNLDVVHAIQEWVTNMRGQTKEELIAGRKDIEDARKALSQFTGLTGEILKKNSDEFLATLGDSPMKQAFAAAAEAFKVAAGRRGSVSEVLMFMEQRLAEQQRVFDALVEGKVKSPDDVRQLLSEQNRLDFQTGRMWIDFIARQNNWTPEQQKELFEELFTTLSDSGNASIQELMALREIIDGLKSESEDFNIQEERQTQITRSVAGITEGQANLVVGHLSTINAFIQSIYELMQRALDNFTAAAGGIPSPAGGVTFGPGAIVVNGGANATAREIVDVLSTDLRAKGVKI